MPSFIYIPPSERTARRHLNQALLAAGPQTLAKRDFMRAYCSLAYLYPRFHPDSPRRQTGLTRGECRLARDAWRRYRDGELTTNELYPYQATKAGLKPV